MSARRKATLATRVGGGMDQALAALRLSHRQEIAARLRMARKRHRQGVFGFTTRPRRNTNSRFQKTNQLTKHMPLARIRPHEKCPQKLRALPRKTPNISGRP
ncbi:MAG: hypothetical protein JNL25_10890 [Rhodospirillaceae bacterium]|nr:hypothetical protein [Rhodospirillaceae bacterium]